MKIAIIGKVNPNLTYEEWVNLWAHNFYVEGISNISIHLGPSTTKVKNNNNYEREPTYTDLKYLRAIGQEDLLSVEDEVELIKQIQGGVGEVDAAKEKLMNANQRFVYSVAKQYASDKFTLEELMSEGNLGLEHAIYKFDETRGFKFISYAVWWIRQSIQQAIVLKVRTESEQKELSERELDILRMHFGFGREKASIEEIQSKYDLPPYRVMAIKDKALLKLFKCKETLGTVRTALMGDAETNKNKK